VTDSAEQREVLERLRRELAAGPVAPSDVLPSLWPPSPPRSATDWPAVETALGRSAVAGRPATRSAWARLRWMVARLVAPWRPARHEALRTTVAGLAAGLRELEQEVVRLHAALGVLEQLQQSSTRRLDVALAETRAALQAPGPAAAPRSEPGSE
jgi:hypothetical protein